MVALIFKLKLSLTKKEKGNKGNKDNYLG